MPGGGLRELAEEATMYQQERQPQQSAYGRQTVPQQTYGQGQPIQQGTQPIQQGTLTESRGQFYGQSPVGQQGGQMQPQVGQTQLPQFGGQRPGQQAAQYGPQPASIGQQPAPSAPQPTQFDASVSPEIRAVIDSLETVTEVGEWCANRCLDEGRQMAQCVRVCHDLADVADLSARLVERNSAVGPAHVNAFVGAAEQSLPELRRHDQPHVVEMANVVERAIDSSYKVLNSIDWLTPRTQQISGHGSF